MTHGLRPGPGEEGKGRAREVMSARWSLNKLAYPPMQPERWVTGEHGCRGEDVPPKLKLTEQKTRRGERGNVVVVRPRKPSNDDDNHQSRRTLSSEGAHDQDDTSRC